LAGIALALAAIPGTVPSMAAPRALSSAAAAYASISIMQPSRDETIFDNAGRVDVRLALTPELHGADRVALLLDGREVAVRSAVRFTLREIPRGEHRLEAWVLAEDGRVLAKSATVVFNVWQASRLFPNRGGK
jgi:hypothetical protein